MAQEIASPLLRARALGGLGRLALAEERAGTAAFFFDEGTAIARDLGLSFVLVRCLTGRAETAARQRDRGNARRFWEEALEVARTNGDQAAAAKWRRLVDVRTAHAGATATSSLDDARAEGGIDELEVCLRRSAGSVRSTGTGRTGRGRAT